MRPARRRTRTGCSSSATATILDEITLGRRPDHDPGQLLARLATLGL